MSESTRKHATSFAWQYLTELGVCALLVFAGSPILYLLFSLFCVALLAGANSTK